MAKNRPQRASGQTTSYGVQQNQMGVTASGVDTFVQPGLEGAPSAPVGAIQPVAPDDQGVKDQLALAKSLDMLSGSARQLGEADASGYKKMEEFGAEMAILQKQMEDTGLVFAEEVQAGHLIAMQHPAALLGQAKSMSATAARSYYDKANAEKEDYRANNPSALNMDATMARWDAGIAAIETPDIGRSDVFQRNLISAQSALRAGYEADHEEWLSNRILDESRLEVQENVGSIVDALATFKLAPTFNTPAHGASATATSPQTGAALPLGPFGALQTTPATPQQTFDAAVAQGAEQMTKLLDDARGGLHVPNEMHELIGFALVDIAANENNPYASRLAEQVLLTTKTGQKDARTNLWEVGSVNKYYRDKKDTIAAHQANRTAAGNNKAFKAGIQQYRNTLIQSLTQGRWDTNSRLNPIEFKKQVFKDFQDSNIIEVDGLTLEKDGDKILFTDADGNSGTIDYEDIVQESDDMYFQQVYDGNLKDVLANNSQYEDEVNRGVPTTVSYTPFPEATAQALAAAQSNVPSEVISASFDQSWQMINSANANGDPEDIAMGHQAFEQAMHAFTALQSLGSESLINRHIPDRRTRDFFNAMHLLHTNNTAATLLRTGTMDLLYRKALDFGQVSPETIASLESQWQALDQDGNAVGGYAAVLDVLHADGTAYSDIRKVAQEITNVAKVLNFVGGMPIADAIETATEWKNKGLVQLGGTHVDKEDVDDAILNGVIPIDGLPKVIDDQQFGFLDRILETQKSETGPTNVNVVREDLSPIGNIARVWWATVYHGLDFAEAVLDPSSKKTVQSVMNDVGLYVVKNSFPTSRDVTTQEALNASAERMRLNPPKAFAAVNQELDGKFVDWAMVPDSKGMAYVAIMEGPEGLQSYALNPASSPGERDMPWTWEEIVALGDWDNKDKTWTDRSAKAPKQQTGFRHPLNILQGLTGDNSPKARNLRLQSYTDHVRNQGVRTGVIYSATGNIIEQ